MTISSAEQMTTLIGSSDTNLYMEAGLFRIKVGGYSVMEITDPNETGGGFALKSQVDS